MDVPNEEACCEPSSKRQKQEVDTGMPAGTEAEFAVNGMQFKFKQGAQPEKAAVFVPVGFGELAQRQGKEDEVCWGCRHLTRPARKNVDPQIWQMLEFIQQNQYTLSEKDFARQLSELHNRLIVIPRREENLPVLEWPEHLVRVHFNSSAHGATRRNLYARILHKLNTVNDELALNIKRRNAETGAEEPDYKAIEAFDKNANTLAKYLLMDIDKISGAI